MEKLQIARCLCYVWMKTFCPQKIQKYIHSQYWSLEGNYIQTGNGYASWDSICQCKDSSISIKLESVCIKMAGVRSVTKNISRARSAWKSPRDDDPFPGMSDEVLKEYPLKLHRYMLADFKASDPVKHLPEVPWFCQVEVFHISRRYLFYVSGSIVAWPRLDLLWFEPRLPPVHWPEWAVDSQRFG